MFKTNLLNYILFLLIIAVIYTIWAIQPLPFDDWCVTKLHTLFLRPLLPETGQQIRYSFSGMYFFTTNPFSLFKAWSLFTAIVSTSLLWAALSKEKTFIRAGLTLITLLGFPYFGHIGAWNHAAAGYILSLLWMMLWYVVYRKIRYTNTQFSLKTILFFVLTFIAASWHEAWLIAFLGICGYFIFDALFLLQKRGRSFKLKSLSIHLSVIFAYMLAVAFYTRGGPSQFLDVRQGTPGAGIFESLLTWRHAIAAFLIGTKENLVLIKDTLPAFLLIIYIKLNKRLQNKLSADFILFLVIALGSMLLLYIIAFISGDAPWRVRWLCAVSLSVAFYALPESILIDRFRFLRRGSFIKAVRFCSIIIAVIWLSYNAYFTYVYTNIDVARWLQYRQMVLNRNPEAMKELTGCSTLPKNRPKGVADWDHIWGAQDDRYRFFMGPSEEMIRKAVNAVWDDKSTKHFFIY